MVVSRQYGVSVNSVELQRELEKAGLLPNPGVSLIGSGVPRL